MSSEPEDSVLQDLWGEDEELPEIDWDKVPDAEQMARILREKKVAEFLRAMGFE